MDYVELKSDIKQWAHDLGFADMGVSDVDLSQEEKALQEWLDRQYHGSMQYMAEHGTKRTRPQELVPGTIRVITVRMDYWSGEDKAEQILEQPDRAYISRYALGRDYHKLIRKRLQKLAKKIEFKIGPFGYRAFTDSAPVMEKPLARKAGLGWQGKHSNLIHPKSGSWFFLGELYTDLPLPLDKNHAPHCGNCNRCIPACPTDAIVAPFQVDARKCISYLTIESKASIPEHLRPQMGNRVFGCDDCQLVCPFNKFARKTKETDFSPRHHLDNVQLLELFGWDEDTFLRNTEGSAIRRIGYQRWIRNLAVGLGNGSTRPEVITALQQKRDQVGDMAREHIDWALAQLLTSQDAP